MSNENKDKNRFFYLDAIRVISALIIMLFHFNVNAFSTNQSSFLIGKLQYLGVSVGDMGVSLFIIISGAALMLSNSKEFSSIVFFKKRIIAIYPSFWVSYLAVGIVFFIINGHTPGDGQHWKFILSITGLDGYFLYRMQNYYLVGEWFTGYIILTYLFFPLLRKGLIKAPMITWLIVLALYIVLNYYYSDIFNVYETCNPLTRLPDFLFGMTYAHYIVKDKEKVNFSIIFAIFVLFCIYFIKPTSLYHPVMQTLGIALFAVLAGLCEKISPRNGIRAYFTYFSGLSFLAFLVHHQIIYALAKYLNYSAMNHLESYYYYFVIVCLSFLSAMALKKPTDKLTEKMQELFKKTLTN